MHIPGSNVLVKFTNTFLTQRQLGCCFFILKYIYLKKITASVVDTHLEMKKEPGRKKERKNLKSKEKFKFQKNYEFK